MRACFRLSVMVAALLAGAGGAAALTLEAALPRGKAVCYGGAGEGVPGGYFKLVRVTRPERLQSYDDGPSRMVRVVVNFARPAGARLEDTASCRQIDGEIACRSTTCDGAVFVLREEKDGVIRIKFDTPRPRSLWSCAEAPLRDIAPEDAERFVPVTRSTGACIE